jgi:hypothetical protein
MKPVPSAQHLKTLGVILALTACNTPKSGSNTNAENPIAPVIVSFTTNPSTINAGGSSTLKWEVTGSAPVITGLDQGIGTVGERFRQRAPPRTRSQRRTVQEQSRNP